MVSETLVWRSSATPSAEGGKLTQGLTHDTKSLFGGGRAGGGCCVRLRSPGWDKWAARDQLPMELGRGPERTN